MVSPLPDGDHDAKRDIAVEEDDEEYASRVNATLEKAAHVVQAEQPIDTSKRDEEVAVAKTSLEEEEETQPGLPFSKARAIALVLTVTSASFLNVGLSSFLSPLVPLIFFPFCLV